MRHLLLAAALATPSVALAAEPEDVAIAAGAAVATTAICSTNPVVRSV